MNEKENDSYNENITDEKEVYTSEWLKENTSIHGWLYVFFIVTIAGGLISAMEIFTINPKDYPYNNCLMATDILVGVLAFGLSVYTVYLFIARKPNAIFYGRICVISCFLSNLPLPTDKIGFFTPIIDIQRLIIYCVIWFLYLTYSKQVKEIIPKSFKKVYKHDWAILAGIIIVPVILFVIGTFQVFASTNEFSNQVDEISTTALAPNEVRDERIIFAIPDGFTWKTEDVVVEGTQISIFYLHNDEIGNCTICSDYNSDTSQSNFDSYWENWQDNNLNLYPMDDIDRGTTTINGNTCLYRIVRYDCNGVYVYWRYYLLFNTKKGKIFVASCYDRNTSSSYINELLSSVKF